MHTCPPPRTVSDNIGELRGIIDDFSSDTRNQATRNASLLERATRAETALDAARQRIEALHRHRRSD